MQPYVIMHGLATGLIQLQQQESHSYPSWEVLGGMRSDLMIACLAKLVSTAARGQAKHEENPAFCHCIRYNDTKFGKIYLLQERSPIRYKDTCLARDTVRYRDQFLRN
jgi:hypothetical protein